MADPITQAVVLTGFKRILFFLTGIASKKIQKKYFPLDLNKLIFELENTPSIYVSDEYFNAECTVNLKLINYSLYDIVIDSAICEVYITSKNCGLFDLNKSKLLKLRKDGYGQYWFSKSLTSYELNRVKKIFEDNKSAESSFEFDFSLFTIFGVQNFRKTINRNIEFRIQ